MHGLNTIIHNNAAREREDNIARTLTLDSTLSYTGAHDIMRRFDEALAAGDVEELEALEDEAPSLAAEFARTRATTKVDYNI